MPYCTIEEAWGDNQFNLVQDQIKQANRKIQQQQESEIPKIIVPENSYDFQDMYNNVSYPHVDYTDKLLSVYPVKEAPLENPPREFDIYGRSNYSNLSLHNDQNKLLQGNQNHIKEYKNVQDNVELRLHKNNEVTQNIEEPKNQQMQNMNDNNERKRNERKEAREIRRKARNREREQQNKNRETFSNQKQISYIEHLENQNEQLRQLLQTFQNKNDQGDMKSNMFDLLLYIISGIFIIFILDSFIKLIKNK